MQTIELAARGTNHMYLVKLTISNAEIVSTLLIIESRNASIEIISIEDSVATIPTIAIVVRTYDDELSQGDFVAEFVTTSNSLSDIRNAINVIE